ncbi:NUDIX domain-containing protein [Halobacterium salinarum]|uniref:GDP-mannose mannosyl hydrolase n=1 Tax=Halobacterium salinarum TaxID=2242 RepID=UPI00255582D2|nr:NUDIX domain-containing protein [Halobacterium salinarum]MDL0131098.1 NUDIX domain-containing protein [Halobacterium salinarum]
MADNVTWIPDDVWADIVEHVPVPSVDLVVKCTDGILLAKRQNEPAKGKWFVPGGRIQKGESLTEAVHRVAKAELGVEVKITERLGAYDHFYETSDVAESGGKHYVAHGYVVTPESEAVTLDEQHAKAETFPIDALPALHPHVTAYLNDANAISD